MLETSGQGDPLTSVPSIDRNTFFDILPAALRGNAVIELMCFGIL
jgi:hypothetical protein